MSRYEPRKSKSRTFEPPVAPMPISTIPESNLLGGMQNNMIYLAMGVAAVSLGTSIFLYREMKTIKSEVSELEKVNKTIKNTEKTLEENSQSVKELTDKVNQLGMMMQRILGGPPPSAPRPPDVSKISPKIEKKLEQNLPNVENSKIVNGGPDDKNCEDGVCVIEPTKKDTKILSI